MQKVNIGIDLGGTKILAVATDRNGVVLGRAKGKTDISGGISGIAEQMRERAGRALENAQLSWADVEAVGMAVPTSVDPRTGEALHAPNLGWKNEPVLPLFRKVFACQVFLENDVNCGTLAEARIGIAAGLPSVAGFFVGTGLGGGLILDGRLRRGERGSAGEFGHQIVRTNGRRCGCGHRGCLEAYCSKAGFSRYLDKQINGRGRKSILTGMLGNDFSALKSSVLGKAYRAGDAVVREALDKGAFALGAGVANVVNICAPDCVVLGGGVIEALGSELLPIIRKSLDAHLFALSPKDVRLEISKLGDDAVPLGAAILAQAEGAV